MKNLKIIIVVLFGIGVFSLLISSQLPSEFVVEVAGTTGTKFSGTYIVVNSNGAQSQNFSGTVPQSFKVKGQIVSATFQNKGRTGMLTLKIKDGDTVLVESNSTEPYGVVAASSN